MLYIPSYRCNVACSTMCTERLVRLTIERYVLFVAHIIRRCTTCSIEKFSSYNCQGIKTIVHTLNYYTRIPSPCFLLYFSRNFLSFFIVLIPAAWNEDSFPKAKRNWNCQRCIYICFLKRNVVPVEEDRVKPVRTFYCNQTRHSSKNNYSFSWSGRNSKVWICKSWPTSLSRSSFVLSFASSLSSLLAKFVELTL